MKKVFAEIGFGNDSFFSTEFEEGDHEYRIPKLIMPGKIHSVYFRFWIFKKVFILSTNHGIEIKNKEKNRLKILFGISGESKTDNIQHGQPKNMNIKIGIYEHYKGHRYKVIGIAKHSETLEDLVVYESLYENKVSKLWVRPLSMFLEEVEVDGRKIPRFKYISEM